MKCVFSAPFFSRTLWNCPDLKFIKILLIFWKGRVKCVTLYFSRPSLIAFYETEKNLIDLLRRKFSTPIWMPIVFSEIEGKEFKFIFGLFQTDSTIIQWWKTYVDAKYQNDIIQMLDKSQLENIKLFHLNWLEPLHFHVGHGIWLHRLFFSNPLFLAAMNVFCNNWLSEQKKETFLESVNFSSDCLSYKNYQKRKSNYAFSILCSLDWTNLYLMRKQYIILIQFFKILTHMIVIS